MQRGWEVRAGLGCMLGNKGGWADFRPGPAEGVPDVTPAHLGWREHAKGTSTDSSGKFVWLCCGNEACFYRVWQLGLDLGQGTWG